MFSIESDDPSHHEQTLLPQSYISLHVLLKTWAMFLLNK